MSLILDALNRSRRGDSEVPGLASEHYVESRPPAWRQYLPWGGLAVALVVIVALLLRGETETVDQGSTESLAAPVAGPERAKPAAAQEPPTVQAAGLAAAKPQPIQRPRQQPPQPTAVAAAPAASGTGAKGSPAISNEDRALLESLYARSREPAPEAQAAPKAQTKPKPKAQAKPKPQPKPAPTVPATAEEPVDVEGMLLQAREQMANAKLVEHPAPFIASLSQQVKNDIPTVFYQKHDYSNQGGQSRVTLNGKALRVGGSPASGMKVDEILEDSVILTYRGTQFRLRALNSWVNL